MPRFLIKSDIVRNLHLEREALAGKMTPVNWGEMTAIRKWVDRLAPATGIAWIDALLEALGVQVEISGRGLDQIPPLGPFIVLANHPFGLIDSLLLIRIFGARRPDFRLASRYPLHEIEPIQSYLLSPVVDEQEAWLPTNRLHSHLRSGHALGIFPAGAVASIRRKDGRVSDKPWEPSVATCVHAAAVPVVPVYFEGANSLFFHMLGLLGPRLCDQGIPRETFRQQNKTLRVGVGRPISPRLLAPLQEPQKLNDYLRARTYSLRSSLASMPLSQQKRPIAVPEPVLEVRYNAEVAREVAALDPGCLVCTQQQFEVYCAKSQQIPHTLSEIGRLRECTFRQVGEGTGKEKDLDAFDAYYLHLFLWDKDQQQLVGAYRMGRGDEIMVQRGIKGLYIRSLFKINPAFRLVLEKSVELGRSFILPSYQRQRLPLFLLWKGIYTYLGQYPHLQYLIGPVSISNDYSTLSRAYIYHFIRRHYFDWEMAEFIKPRKRFRPKISETEVVDGLLSGDSPDLREVDAVIADIEPNHMRLPVLLKKYIRQNARIIGFNLDPDFNHCLDGLILLDLRQLPAPTEDMMT